MEDEGGTMGIGGVTICRCGGAGFSGVDKEGRGCVGGEGGNDTY